MVLTGIVVRQGLTSLYSTDPSKVSTVENTMPPIIGAAIHFITSIPLPVVHIMGFPYR